MSLLNNGSGHEDTGETCKDSALSCKALTGETLEAFAKRLSASQVSLDAESQKVLNENFWSLVQ